MGVVDYGKKRESERKRERLREGEEGERQTRQREERGTECGDMGGAG